MTREEAIEFMWVENHKKPVAIKWQHHKTIRDLVEKLIHKIYDDFEAQMKAKDEEIERLKKECEYDQRNASMSQKESVQHLEEIERLKKVIDTSIEEIEYAIKKPQYAEVYLGNAIRFLKDKA